MWSQQLLTYAQANQLHRPRAVVRLVIVTAVALTAALTVLFGWGAVALLGHPAWWANLSTVAAVLVLFWAVFPRIDSFPPKELHITATEYPKVSAMIDAVAAEHGVRRPTVLFSEQFAAGFARIGLRRKPVVVLGHALLAILEPDEMVALAAHELAHMRDGSWTRHMFVRVPHTAVERIARVLVGRRPTAESPRVWRALHRLRSIVTFPLLGPVWLFRLAQAWDAQIAEYEADRLATAVAGRSAALSLLRKSHYHRLDALQQAFDSASPRERLAALRQALDAAPTRELARLVHTAHMLPVSLTALHPHFVERTANVAHMPARPPRVVVSEDDARALRDELAAWPQRFHELKTAYGVESSSPRPIPAVVEATASA